MADPRLMPSLITPELFTNVEQWGWEYRDTRTIGEIYPVAAPIAQIGQPEWASWAAEQQEPIQRRRNFLKTYLLAAIALTVISALLIDPLTALVPLVVAAVLTWMMFGRSATLAKRADEEHAAWLLHCLTQQQQLLSRIDDWQRQREEHNQREIAVLQQIPTWVPLKPDTAELIEICGGSFAGWRALLATVGASMLGSGQQLTVVDLSQESVAQQLAQMVRGQGKHVATARFPSSPPAANLFAGLTAAEVTAVVVETIRGIDRPDLATEQHVDATVLKAVTEVISPHITCSRLAAALRVLLDDPTKPSTSDLISPAEITALHGLFGEKILRNAETRLFQLSAVLDQLADYDNPASADTLLGSAFAPLRILELESLRTTTSTSLLAQTLTQILVHQIAKESTSYLSRVLFIAGADVLTREQVEQLDHLARAHRIRLVLMFRHLRGDAVDLLGGGDVAIVMQLGNAQEAEHAANFIGREHSLVASQFTISRSQSMSMRRSKSESHTKGEHSSTTETRSMATRRRGGLESVATTYGISESRSASRGRSEETGTSQAESISFSRTYDYAITPRALQELSPTAFVLVDRRDPNCPRLGDCDPAILEQQDYLMN